MKNKLWIWILGIVFLLLTVLGILAYRSTLANNVRQEALLFIPPGASYQAVLDSLERQSVLLRRASFDRWARLKRYPEQVKPGRYRISPPMSNRALLNKLLAGRQEPLRVVLHHIQYPRELAGVLGKHLAADSAAFAELLTDASFLQKQGFTRATAWAIFLPNSYDFYWTEQPEGVFKKMLRYYRLFWTEERRKAATRQGLSTEEVLTLASIVERETVQPDEMPVVAGLYLNRLRMGMKLQSDPTVLFAIRQQYPDTLIKRVLFAHLRHTSPYNTYQNPGLPPGPILIPSEAAIKAVLSPAQHRYIYMTADPDRPGYHRFASSWSEHQANRRRYIRWIRSQP